MIPIVVITKFSIERLGKWEARGKFSDNIEALRWKNGQILIVLLLHLLYHSIFIVIHVGYIIFVALSVLLTFDSRSLMNNYRTLLCILVKILWEQPKIRWGYFVKHVIESLLLKWIDRWMILCFFQVL